MEDWQAIKESSAARFDVVGIGEISLDHVAVSEGIPGPGEKAELRSLTDAPGGSVATTLLGCQKLGLRACLQAAIGKDPAGQQALAPLRAAGVNIEGVTAVANVPTRRAVILVDSRSGERRVFGARDSRLRCAQGPREEQAIRDARVLLIDTSDLAAAQWGAACARESGTAVLLDADAPWPKAEELLRLVDYPVVSEVCARGLGPDGSMEAGLALLESYGARFAVATQGALGCTARIGGETLQCPAFAVDARDTTGAGDAFRAGLIWSLLRPEKSSPRDTLCVANANGALACLGEGAQGGLVGPEELGSFLGSRSA